MNPGNIWTQKVLLNGEGEGQVRSEISGQRPAHHHHPNLYGLSFQNTRTAMVLALSGLTTVATTKVEYPHSELERHVL